jgi:hypothetical protein
MASMALAAGDQLQRASATKEVVPVRIGQLGPDHSIIRWVDYGNRQECTFDLTFDCYEPDVGDDCGFGDAYPVGGDDCGINTNECVGSPSLRWYFGRSYCNMYSSNDMKFDPAYSGRSAERICIAWQWWVNGPQTGENMALVVETFDGFDETCQFGDPNGFGNWLGGVVAYYGYYNGSAGGYYYTDLDLCGYDWVPLPPNGYGSYNLWILTYDDADPNVLYLATCGQPMLWGSGLDEYPTQDCTDRGHGPCPDGESSDQDSIQWDDDTNYDGWHDAPDECYDYTFGVCPDPLGSMVCMWVDEDGDECVGDIDGDGRTYQEDLGLLLQSWGLCPGDPGYNPDANIDDFDGTGCINQADLGVLLGDWGCGM